MTVLLTNIRRIFKKKLNFLFMLVIPVLLTVVVVVGSTGNAVYKVTLVDNDNTKLTQLFSDFLKDKSENIKLVDFKEDEIKNAVINSKIDCGIVINKDFTKNVLSGKDDNVDFYMLEGTNANEPIKLSISSFFSSAKTISKSANQDENIFYQSMDKYLHGSLKLDNKKFDGEAENSQRKTLSIGFFAMGLMLLMMSATTLIMKDKEYKTFTRIMTTPVSLRSYFLQNIISFTLVAFIQIVVVLYILWKGYHIDFGGVFPQLVLLSMLFALTCVSIGIIISRYAKKSSHVNATVALLTMPMLMLGGCLWPFDFMPQSLQRIGQLIPTRWYMLAATKIFEGKSIADCAVQIGLMLAFAFVMFVLTFIRKVDMSKS